MSPICPYCGQESRPAGGDEIYPHRPDLHHKQFFLCAPCDAYVGTHERSGKPLGRLANAELRYLKSAAHRAFDPLWKGGRFGSRRKAYAWLAEQMELPPTEAHIGMFNEDQCREVIRRCNHERL